MQKIRKYPVSASILLFLIFLSVAAGNCFAEAEADAPLTSFLPLKVISGADARELAAKSDASLLARLSSVNIPLVERQQVMPLLARDVWPPEKDNVAAFIINPAIVYAVVGTLTRTGTSLSIDMTAYNILSSEPPKYFFAEAPSEEELDSAIKLIVENVLAYTQRSFRIGKITITGNRKTDSGAILRNISARQGDVFDAQVLRNDMKKIFRMGYFDDVRIETNDLESGKEIVFTVSEKALIGSVSISGNKELKEDDVREVVTISPNTIINTKEVKSSEQNIKKLYKEKGYLETEVTASIDHFKEDRVNVRFDIKEGEKVYIREIRIVGSEAYPAKRIKKLLSTTEKGFFSWITESGHLKRDILEQDTARIAAFYNNEGFIEAKVGDPEITQEGGWLYITFNISEGERYKVGAIDIQGELIADKAELFQSIQLDKEEYFSRKILREDIMRLTDYYAERGYAFAEVAPTMNRDQFDKRMGVTISIEKGVLVNIGRILVRGNTRTRDKVIRREMKIEEGGIFDASALRKSTQQLQRLEYFEEVNITPELAGSEDLMDIIVNVKEKPTGTFSIGAGYSSVENLMFMAEVSQNNFLGKGQRVAVQANISGKTNRYSLSFTEPHLGDSQLLAGIDIYDWSREYDDYTKESTGFALRFGYPIWEMWKLYFSYGFDNTDLTDVLPTAPIQITESIDIHETSYVKLGFVRDTRDRIYDASTGSQNSINIKYAGGPLGGDSAFTKLEGSSGWYFPLWWDTTLHIEASIGYVFENSTDKLPIYEKFYLGGLNSVRGFESGKISPYVVKDGRIYRTGGEKMWYINEEWIFPIVKDAGLKGVLFFDAGNAFEESDDWDISDLRTSAGLGFRWLSPMGPLRLEWGYNIHPRPDEDSSVWDFSIGGSF